MCKIESNIYAGAGIAEAFCLRKYATTPRPAGAKRTTKQNTLVVAATALEARLLKRPPLSS